MKKLLIVLATGAIMMSCNNAANDGDANTDTTNMPVDPSMNKDTVNHINRADGTQMQDTSADTLR